MKQKIIVQRFNNNLWFSGYWEQQYSIISQWTQEIRDWLMGTSATHQALHTSGEVAKPALSISTTSSFNMSWRTTVSNAVTNIFSKSQ